MPEAIGFKVEADAADAVAALLKVEKAQKRTERGAKKVSQATAKGTKEVKGFGTAGGAGLLKVAAGFISIAAAMRIVTALFREMREEQRKSSEAARTFQQEFATTVVGAGFDPVQAKALEVFALGPAAAGLDPTAIVRNIRIVEAQARAAGVKIGIVQAGRLGVKAARLGQIDPATGEEFAKIAGALAVPGVPVEEIERGALRILETKGTLQFGKKQALTTALLREAGVSQNEIVALFGAGSQNIKALTEFLDFLQRGATKEARPIEKELFESVRKGGIAAGLRFAQERPEFAKATIAVLQKNLQRELEEIEAGPLPDIEQRRRELAATVPGRLALKARRAEAEIVRARTLKIIEAEFDPEIARLEAEAKRIRDRTTAGGRILARISEEIGEAARPIVTQFGEEVFGFERPEQRGFRDPGMAGTERAIREQTDVIRGGQGGNGARELMPAPGGIPIPGGSADEP